MKHRYSSMFGFPGRPDASQLMEEEYSYLVGMQEFDLAGYVDSFYERGRHGGK